MGARAAVISTLQIPVVFDTNVVLSSLVFTHGRLAWLREHYRSGLSVPQVSQATVAELTRVLAYPKFRISALEQFDLLSDYIPFCRVTEVHVRCPITCRDPKDQTLLDLAQSGNAHILITGDQDLLVLAEQTEFVIETPEQYHTRFEH